MQVTSWVNRVARAHNFYSCYNQANAYGCFLGHLERWISAVSQTDFVEAHNQRRLFGLVGWGGALGGGWGGARRRRALLFSSIFDLPEAVRKYLQVVISHL